MSDTILYFPVLHMAHFLKQIEHRCIVSLRVSARKFCNSKDDSSSGTGKQRTNSSNKKSTSSTESITKRSKSSTETAAKEKPVVSHFVARARLLEYWERNDRALEAQLDGGKVVMMLEKEPLVEISANGSANAGPKLKIFGYTELRKKVNLYGLEIGLLNSALLDVVPSTQNEREFSSPTYRPLFGCALRIMTPPEDSGISIESVREDFASTLDGKFMKLQTAMRTMSDDYHSNMLAKFQALTRWYNIFRQCPKCGTILHMRASKTLATCLRCDLDFYPTISPVIICLVRDPLNEYCLLTRRKGSPPTLFTAISGFCSAGETLENTVRREVAEEIGIECYAIKALNMSQPWPIPDSSLMCGFASTADMSQRLDPAPDEIEYAQWFSRAEVEMALRRTEQDPLFKNIKICVKKFLHIPYSELPAEHFELSSAPKGAELRKNEKILAADFHSYPLPQLTDVHSNHMLAAPVLASFPELPQPPLPPHPPLPPQEGPMPNNWASVKEINEIATMSINKVKFRALVQHATLLDIFRVLGE
ncbi:NUDIX domain-containing protein [Ditylenchus destructor]|uniref:NAD(+) diphosphatase n=1 Tax=Ditylenchus destructor TaxID=166010 RepID=A0AAD4RD31_9BILA|nr:NUDIX domain-containing protein [Ditylenchus destructor]